MAPAFSRRIVLLALVAGLSLFAGVSSAYARAPVEGRWAARLPGGAVSYYHFHGATRHPDDTFQGRFDHVFIDDRGIERTVHGTYLLSTVANRGRLTLLFDDGSRTTDVEHRAEGVLLLRHLGSGQMIAFVRQ
jgi:hypothetical protein